MLYLTLFIVLLPLLRTSVNDLTRLKSWPGIKMFVIFESEQNLMQMDYKRLAKFYPEMNMLRRRIISDIRGLRDVTLKQ